MCKFHIALRCPTAIGACTTSKSLQLVAALPYPAEEERQL